MMFPSVTRLGLRRSVTYLANPSNCLDQHLTLLENPNCYTVRRSVIYKTSFHFSTEINTTGSAHSKLDAVKFRKISDDTLDSLTEYFDKVVERAVDLHEADVSYGDGVLTVKFGAIHGTYVINRQSPNRQIWLSSPISGPKRYDFADGEWIYSYNGKSLHRLLDEEIPLIVQEKTCFTKKCAFGKKESK